MRQLSKRRRAYFLVSPLRNLVQLSLAIVMGVTETNLLESLALHDCESRSSMW